MPVEIKELIIRASVRDESEGNSGTAGTPAGPARHHGAVQEEQIVTRCVEQVLDILRIQNER